MPDDLKECARYRKMAAECVEIGQRMSLNEDRARLFNMAEHWLRLAQETEAKALASGGDKAPSQHDGTGAR